MIVMIVPNGLVDSKVKYRLSGDASLEMIIIEMRGEMPEIEE